MRCYHCSPDHQTLAIRGAIRFDGDCLHSANPGRPRCRYFRYPAWRLYWHLCIYAKGNGTEWGSETEFGSGAGGRAQSLDSRVRCSPDLHLITIRRGRCVGVDQFIFVSLRGRGTFSICTVSLNHTCRFSFIFSLLSLNT